MITNPATVRAMITSGGNLPDEVFTPAYEAAENYVQARVRIPDGDTPPALVEAVALLTARYLARRNTPDGLVGLGDLGAVRLPTTDGDVRSLIAPYRPVVFG